MLLICAALAAELKVAKACRTKKGVQFLCTWVGNYRTIFSLTNYLSTRPEVDEVLFVGVCGWHETKQEIVQVANVINAHTGKEIILPIYKQYAPLVTVLSSETPIHNIDQMWPYHFVDMESRWVALVTEQFRVPCTILRIPIDEIGTESCTTFDRAGAIEEMRRVLSTYK